MQSMDSLRRDKLYRLWKTVTNDAEFERTLERDTVVPSRFLNQNGIMLLEYDIEKIDADGNFTHNSPVLFRPAPREFFQRYHIDVNGFDSPWDRDCYMNYRKCNPRDGNEHVPEKWRPKEFTYHVAIFLEKWAFGSFPREIPGNISPYFPDNYGIRKPLYETPIHSESKFDF